MAKSTANANNASVSKGKNKILDEKFDGKNRVVTLSTDGSKFIVEKLQLNAPFSESFKTQKEALTVFNEKVDCTQN